MSQVDWKGEAQTREDQAGRLIAGRSDDPEFNRTFELAAQRRHLLGQLVQRRSDLGWSQERLAKELHTTQSTISAIEHGRKDSRVWTLLRMAEALGCYIEFKLCPYGANGGAPDPSEHLSQLPSEAL